MEMDLTQIVGTPTNTAFRDMCIYNKDQKSIEYILEALE